MARCGSGVGRGRRRPERRRIATQGGASRLNPDLTSCFTTSTSVKVLQVQVEVPDTCGSHNVRSPPGKSQDL
eukprot:1003381-Prymnesium_polylepis.1